MPKQLIFQTEINSNIKRLKAAAFTSKTEKHRHDQKPMLNVVSCYKEILFRKTCFLPQVNRDDCNPPNAPA